MTYRELTTSTVRATGLLALAGVGACAARGPDPATAELRAEVIAMKQELRAVSHEVQETKKDLAVLVGRLETIAETSRYLLKQGTGPAPEGPDGPPLKTEGLAIEASKVTECDARPYMGLAEDERLLGVELKLENGGTEALRVLPLSFHLESADGQRHKPSFLGCQPLLKTTELDPGKAAKGFLTFRVPREARRFRLMYAPVGLDGGPRSVPLPASPGLLKRW